MIKVFISGCFNALHLGHIYFFSQAKALGDHLTVCVPSDRVLLMYKQQKQILPLEHKIGVLKSLETIDDVVIGDDMDACGLNFKTEFLRIKPDILAVTEDDKYKPYKEKLCESINCKYVVLPKTLDIKPVTSTEIINFIKSPIKVPLRVDFAGGWLDVPKFSVSDGYIVNCTISPLVSLHNWKYNQNSGLGGSAAYAILMGKNSVQSELDLGVGWQDPAVIQETGLCCWKSGNKPVLEMKRNPEMLKGKMALLWTGLEHNTPSLVDGTRDYTLIKEAGYMASVAVNENYYPTLCCAVRVSYECQINEGMHKLPIYNEVAKKYVGGGWGGYACYLFTNEYERNEFVNNNSNAISIEPYMREY